MASKIFDTQQWRVICDTEEAQDTATLLEILAKSPSGVISTFSATEDAGDSNKIYYDVQIAEMAEAGDWTVWARTTIAGKIAAGDPATIAIHTEGN